MQQQLKFYKTTTYILAAVLLAVATAISLYIQYAQVKAGPSQPQPSASKFQWISVSAHHNPSNFMSGASYDGRYVMFYSSDDLLVSGDTNGVNDVFVKDVQTNLTERVSVDNSGAQYATPSWANVISSNGRFVIFNRQMTPTGYKQVYMRDRVAGTTTMVSTDASGNPANNTVATAYGVSDDGTFVALRVGSLVTNLGSRTNSSDMYIKNTQTGAIGQMPFPDPTGLGHTWSIDSGQVSADGNTFVMRAWDQTANLRDSSNDPIYQLVKVDVANNTSAIISDPSSGNPDTSVSMSVMSRDGRYVAFYPSNAAKPALFNSITIGSYNPSTQVATLFLRDTQTGDLELLDIRNKASSGLNYRGFASGISDDGRYVGLYSKSSNMDPGYSATPAYPTHLDYMLQYSLYERDRVNATTTMFVNQISLNNGRSIFAPGLHGFYFDAIDSLYESDPDGRDIYKVTQ